MTYRATTGICHPGKPRQEYVDWGQGDPFREKPIQIKTNTHKQARIRNYAHTERRRKAPDRNKDVHEPPLRH